MAFFLGAGEKENADRSAAQGLLLSLLHGALLSVGGFLCIPYFLPLFTSDARILDWGMEYAYIVLSFSMVITVQIAFEKIYQAGGEHAGPHGLYGGRLHYQYHSGSGFYFRLGPIPRLEVKGAAIATVIGQVVTLILYLIWYFCKDMGLSLGRRNMSLRVKSAVSCIP